MLVERIKTVLVNMGIVLVPLLIYPLAAGAHVEVPLDAIGLHEGDLIRSSNPQDPDIYIVNEHGYKRLFLSPAIFSFYGHLRSTNVKRVETYFDLLPTAGFFRNCEARDPRVYAIEVTAEDAATLRWINLSADEALVGNHDFFKQVFCINTREFNSYPKGRAYTALSQIPSYARTTLPPPAINETSLPLTLPDGFRISIFTREALGPLRFMAFSPDGILFVSMPSSKGLYATNVSDDGKIFALPDRDNDGKADETVTLVSGLHLPHGIAFYDGYLYVAEEHAISRYLYRGNAAVGTREVIISNLPAGGEGHVSRTIGFGPSGKMYVSVGSSCNSCEESDGRRATILEYNPDGSGERIFAQGLRNTVGFVFHPVTKEIWATENGRDWLGDTLPPDEINIVRTNTHYGWPGCYGKNNVDPAFGNTAFCKITQESTYDIEAHAAPLGLRFIASSQFPAGWQGDILVGLHGSWNRTDPVGYKVIKLLVDGNTVIGEQDFISGWLRPDGSKLGRPVDVLFGPDGALYISDDKANVIYRVTKQ